MSLSLIFVVLKLSGYLFYSVEQNDAVCTFKRTWRDCFAFLLSFSFSVVVYLNITETRVQTEMRSLILTNGLTWLFQILLSSMLITKTINFIEAREMFEFFRLIRFISSNVSFLKFKIDVNF